MKKNVILTIILVYASASFITMQLDSSKWDIVFRAFVIIVALVVFGVLELIRRDVQ